jgi:hypothetical protein
VLFNALENESHVDATRSLEVSRFSLVGATELNEVILRIAVQRVGRYPSVKDGVVLDFNLPDERHWLYRKFEKGEKGDCEAMSEVELPDAAPSCRPSRSSNNLRR